MENIIKSLQHKIEEDEKLGNNEEAVSWNYEYGILISRKEAKIFLQLLQLVHHFQLIRNFFNL